MVKKGGTRRELPMDGSDYDESDEGFDYGVDEDDDEDDDEDVPDIDVLLEGLENSRADVREEAVHTLGKLLKPATLAQHAGAVVARLGDSDRHVRRNALATLGKLDPATLAQHAFAMLARLGDSYVYARAAALKTLGKLEPVVLAQHADAVVARLKDSKEFVRKTALATLGKLEPATLAQPALAAAIADRLDYPAELDESEVAMQTMKALPKVITNNLNLFLRLGARNSLVARRGIGAGSICVGGALRFTGMRFRIVRAARGMRDTWRHGSG